MGYTHDEDVALPISPFHCFGTVATWAIAASQVAGVLAYGCDATDETAHLFIEVRPLSHLPADDGSGLPNKGFKAVDFALDFEILSAALDAMSAVINKVKRGADGAVHVVSNPTFTYDTGHDSDAERIDIDQHRMTLTLDAAYQLYLEDDEYYIIDLTINKAATSTFEFLGGVVHGTLRL